MEIVSKTESLPLGAISFQTLNKLNANSQKY